MSDSLYGQRNIAAVIPALNEAASITNVVNGILPFAYPIVVDDGSTDGTAELARLAGADVVQHTTNKGYDKALETGMFRSLELGFEFAVTLDADGQHNPDLIKQFTTELMAGADLVIGIRDRHQRIAEFLFAFVANVFWKIQDPLCGMKGYRLYAMKRVGHFDSYSSIGTELALRVARSGCKISQIPIQTSKREGASRFGGGLKANWRIIKALLLGILLAKACDMTIVEQ